MNRRAISILSDPEAKPKLLATAAMLLASESQLSGAQRVAIAQSIAPQLRRVAESREPFDLQMAEFGYKEHCAPMLASPHRLSRPSDSDVCLLAELLDLAYRSELQGKLDSTMKIVCEAIGEGAPLVPDGSWLLLSWPDMSFNVRAARRGFAVPRKAGGLMMGGAPPVNPATPPKVNSDPIELLKSVLRMHPMVVDYKQRTQQQEKQDTDAQKQPGGGQPRNGR